MSFANTSVATPHANTPDALLSEPAASHSRAFRHNRHLQAVPPQPNADPSLTLDSIAKNPQLALLLSPDAAAALSLSCAAVMAILQQRSITPVTRPAEDRLINSADVGKLINKSKSWVEHHYDDLPPRRSLAGNPCWLQSEVESWMKTIPRYGRAA